MFSIVLYRLLLLKASEITLKSKNLCDVPRGFSFLKKSITWERMYQEAVSHTILHLVPKLSCIQICLILSVRGQCSGSTKTLTATQEKQYFTSDGYNNGAGSYSRWGQIEVTSFGTWLCSSCWDQIPGTCHVFTRLFTLNTPWYFLDFASLSRWP